jgi:hypothetical protein
MPQQKHHIKFVGASCCWFLAVSVCCFPVCCSKVSWNCLLKHINFLPALLQYNLQVAYNDGMIGAKKPQVYEQWASPHDDCDYDGEKSLLPSNLLSPGFSRLRSHPIHSCRHESCVRLTYTGIFTFFVVPFTDTHNVAKHSAQVHYALASLSVTARQAMHGGH